MGLYPRKGESKGYLGTIRRFTHAMGRNIVDNGDLSGLADLAVIAEEANDVLAQTVRGLREVHGYSWAEIGGGLGVTRATACNRFGEKEAS